MSIIWRKLVYISFISLFIILTPLLILYSLGYRYDFNTNSLEKNGAFYIKSYPKGANIYINNIDTEEKTPRQITNIKPGLYNLEIKKDNYIPWKKQLYIQSGETTFVEDIVLFLENKEKVLLHTGSADYLINQDSSKYAYLDNNLDLIITDIEQERIFNVHSFTKEYNLIAWSVDNKQILLSDNINYYIFNIDQKELNKLSLKNIDKIIFDNYNSNLLWFLNDGKLYKYDISQSFDGLSIDLELENIKDFNIYDNYLIIQYDLLSSSTVEKLRKDNLKSEEIINNLNLGKLNTLKSNNQLLIFSLGTKLYIKHKYADIINIPITIAKIHGNKILLTNGHEIIIYNYENNNQELIDRSTKIVSDIIWHPNGSYFLTEINEQTKIIEIDGRNKRNSIELLSTPLKKLYLFNNKGDKLFILSSKENFYLKIQ